MATERFPKGFLQSLFMTCKEATFIISKEDRVPTPFFKRVHLRIHLLTCNFCTLFRKQIHYINRVVLKKKQENSTLSPEFQETLQQMLLKKIQEENTDL